MLFSQTLVALVAALLVSAFPRASPRGVGDNTTCYYIMTPTPDFGPDALQPSINYAIGHTVGEEYPNTDLNVNIQPLVRHDDGTYDVLSVLSVDGVDNSTVAAFIDSWEDTTLNGLQAAWAVNAVNCNE